MTSNCGIIWEGIEFPVLLSNFTVIPSQWNVPSLDEMKFANFGIQRFAYMVNFTFFANELFWWGGGEGVNVISL